MAGVGCAVHSRSLGHTFAVVARENIEQDVIRLNLRSSFNGGMHQLLLLWPTVHVFAHVGPR